MADNAKCWSAIKACRMRLVRLNACGAPVVAATSVVVSKGFISISASAQIEEGQEFLQKNACGEICINEKDCDILKRYNLDMKFCNVDPSIVEMTTGNQLVLDPASTPANQAKGFGLGEHVQCDAGFSLEIWQKLSGEACDPSGDQSWWYWAWPFLYGGVLGDITWENAAFEFDLTAKSKKISGADQWGADNRGPWATPIFPTGGGLVVGEHVRNYITADQPPDPTCGTIALAAVA